MAFSLRAELMALAPTNPEDPSCGGEEKHHCPQTADFLLSTARRRGPADPGLGYPGEPPRGPGPIL